MWVVNATPQTLYLQERDPVPIVLEAEWAPGTKRCTSTLSLTSVLEYVGGQCHAPTVLLARKRPDSHYIRGWMGSRAEAVYLYTFFNFGARIDGYSMLRPDRFTCEKETRYPLYCRLHGPLAQNGVLLHFL